MAFPNNPNPGDTYTDEYGTVWVYAGPINGWYRQTVIPVNDTTYIGSDGAPGGIGNNTEVVFNDNGSLASDSGLTYNKTTDALSGGAFVPTGSTVPSNGVYRPSANNVAISTNGTGKLFVDASGRVGVGTTEFTNASESLRVENSGGDTQISIIASNTSTGSSTINLGDTDDFNIGMIKYDHSNNSLEFRTNNTPRAIIDSSGRLLVGTSSARTNFFNGAGPAQTQLEGTNYQNAAASIVCNSTDATHPSVLILGKSYSGSVGSNTLVPNGHMIGAIDFQANDGTDFVAAASIQSYVDGVSGANDMPGRLVFSTTADGSSSPTERLRIDSSGRVGIGTTTPSSVLHLKTASSPKLILDNSDSATAAIIDTWWSGAPLAFNIGTTERARIDGSGRLLVGTSSITGIPATLNVIGGNNTVLHTQGANADSPFLFLSHARGTGTQSVNAQDGVGAIAFVGYDGTNALTAARIEAFVDGTPGANDMPGRLVFSTTADGASSPTERMRITSDGLIALSSGSGIGTTLGGKIQIYNGTSGFAASSINHTSNTNPYGLFLDFPNASPDNNTNWFLRCEDSTANRMFVYSDGDVWTSDAGTLTSDETLKRDITDVTPKLADVMNLRVRNFYWQEDYHPNKQDKKLIGFIAQEFEQVFPGLVSEHKIKGGEPILDEKGNETGETTPEVFKKGIKEAKLVPILVKALQEAVERIEQLETKVAALETS